MIMLSPSEGFSRVRWDRAVALCYMEIMAVGQERLAAKLAEIRPYLDERQWRLLLGAEARAIGRVG